MALSMSSTVAKPDSTIRMAEEGEHQEGVDHEAERSAERTTCLPRTSRAGVLGASDTSGLVIQRRHQFDQGRTGPG